MTVASRPRFRFAARSPYRRQPLRGVVDRLRNRIAALAFLGMGYGQDFRAGWNASRCAGTPARIQDGGIDRRNAAAGNYRWSLQSR